MPVHGGVRACSRSTAQQTATTAVGLELGSEDGLDRHDRFRRQERAAVPTLAVSRLEQTNHAFRSCGVRYRSVSQ